MIIITWLSAVLFCLSFVILDDVALWVNIAFKGSAFILLCIANELENEERTIIRGRIHGIINACKTIADKCGIKEDPTNDIR